MRIRRAVGAATLALSAVAALSGCADDPKDKAFGGLGDAPAPPTMPNPSLNPSLRPTGLPDAPGTSAGTSAGTSGGSSSGSSGITSGSDGRPTPRPTYNPSATGEVIGQNCRYEPSTRRIAYDVGIQNSSTDYAFRYTFTVVFKVGSSPSSTIASRTIASRPNTVTVNSGGNRTIKVHTSYSTNDRFAYSCQVTSARKYPAS